MANEIIRPSELPLRSAPVASELTVSDNGSSVAGVTWTDGVNAAVPVSSQSEAEAGVNNSKRMTPLTTKQAIDAQVPPKISAAIGALNLGSASQASVGDFATAAQGAKADSAVQPGSPVLLPAGGAALDILIKSSGSDYDTEWAASAAATAVSYAPQVLTDEQKLQAQSNISLANFKTVQILLDDTSLAYAGDPGKIQVGPGDIITAQGFRYEVAASDAADAHVETAGGVLLYINHQSGRVDIRQAGAMSGGDASRNIAAIRNARNATPIGGELYVPPGEFDIDDQYHHNKTCSLIMDGDFRYVGAAVQPMVKIGSETDTNLLRLQRFRLRGRRATLTDWLNEDDVGFLLVNMHSVIECSMVYTEGFRTNWRFEGHGGSGGPVYSIITLGRSVRAHKHLDIVQFAGGFPNENLWLGGSFLNFHSTHPDDGFSHERAAITIRTGDGTYLNNNNNIFIKPCAEIRTGVALDFQQARMNRVIGMRHETAGLAARFSGSSFGNIVEVAYSTGSNENWEDLSENGSNYVTFQRFMEQNLPKKTVFNLDNIRNRWVPYNATSSFIRGGGIAQVSGPGTINLTGAAGDPDRIKGQNGFVEFVGAGVGRLVDVTKSKRFLIEVDALPDSNHSVLVRAYDASGNLITVPSGSDISDYIVGADRSGQRFTGVAAGFWRTFSTEGVVPLRVVSDDIASLWIGVGIPTGGAPAKIRGLHVMCYDNGVPSSPSPGLGIAEYDYLIAAQAPDRGEHQRGMIVRRHSLTSGGVSGWGCTATGTPGTWVDLASIA